MKRDKQSASFNLTLANIACGVLNLRVSFCAENWVSFMNRLSIFDMVVSAQLFFHEIVQIKLGIWYYVSYKKVKSIVNP